jgi:fatty-acyl-CoA synthase
MSTNAYDNGLDKNEANYVSLSPLSFIQRSRDVFPDYPAVVYGDRRYTWRQAYDRCVRLASALHNLGIGVGDTVTVIAANTPELFEAHYGIPMCGGVLNAVNTRLDADTIAYILDHSDAKVLITDSQFSPMVKAALELYGRDDLHIIDIVDDQATGEGECLGTTDYEAFLDTGTADYAWSLPTDEWQALALNYTSGTSGRPKGVVYHHRGSYLMTMGTVIGWGLPNHPTYLYIVPMFHCNGWGHAWTMTALAGTIVCCRYITAKAIFDSVVEHKITHFGGAPIVLGMLINAPEEDKKSFDHPVKAMTAGAPPPAAVLEQTQALGFDVMHVYGLTETYGHVLHCAWHHEWDALPFRDQAEMKAQQGVRFPMMEGIMVADVGTANPVPANGEVLGEILIRGNAVMKGYYKASDATETAFADGWFHSGDLAVVHPNGYIQIKDRLKDVIISGGENISSVEVEGVLYKHPAVALAAVVATPDDKWGEVPCAFVELKTDASATEDEIIAFCKENMAGFKRPKRVVFGELPKTSTGKIQKFVLRDQVRQTS